MWQNMDSDSVGGHPGAPRSPIPRCLGRTAKLVPDNSRNTRISRLTFTPCKVNSNLGKQYANDGSSSLIFTLIGMILPIAAHAVNVDKTHIYNSKWSPHAKSHDGQILSLSLFWKV